MDNLQECLNEKYKIFNNECYKECPNNSESKIDNSSV